MGNPFVHLDLTSKNPAAAKQFYAEVFDWEFQDLPDMGGYIGINVGTGVGGGIGPAQDGSPTGWTAFVDVDDLDDTIAKVEAAGGKVAQPRMEIPGMGWLAVLVDPEGSTFGIWQGAKPAAPPPAPAKKAAAPKKKAAPAKPAKKAAAPAKPAKKAAPAKPAKKAAAPAKKKKR